MGRALVLLMAVLALVTAGCKLTAKGEAKVEQEEDTEVIVVDVATEPKAHVFLLAGGDPVKSDKVKYAGEDARNPVVANDDGKAKLRLPIWAGDEAKKELRIVVEHTEKRLGRYPRFDLNVTATRSPSLHVKEAEVTCVQKKCKGVIRDDLALVMSEIPDGTKITIAGGPTVTAAGGAAEALPDYTKLFASESLDAVFGEADAPLALPIALELPDGTTLKRDASVSRTSLRTALTAMMKGAANGPVLLPGEAKDAKGTGALVKVAPPGLFGKASKPADVDFVATLADEKERSKSCGGYTSSNGGVADLQLTVIDVSVSIYDRRTGRRRLKKTFGGDPACPQNYARGDGLTYRTTQKEIDDFLATFVKAPNAARGGSGGGAPPMGGGGELF